MLKKYAGQDPKYQDMWLPFLLFANKEIPQASMGFIWETALRVLNIIKEVWCENLKRPEKSN